MSENHAHSVSDFWDGGFNAKELEGWAANLRKRLLAEEVSIGVVFMTPDYFRQAEEVLEIIRIHCRVSMLIGCTGVSVISSAFEYETCPGVSVALYYLPGAKLELIDLPGGFMENDTIEETKTSFPLSKDFDPNAWLIFADPYSLNSEKLLDYFNHVYPGVPIHGGLASGTLEKLKTYLFSNGRVLQSGGVCVAIGGDVTMASMVSQGCLPIGESYTVTSVEKNVLEGIANKQAYEVLNEVFECLPEELQSKSRGNLHVGFVIDEYREEHTRGDFLVRNLIGADPMRGALLVGTLPRVGQTMQFQLRDRHAAMEDLNVMVDKLSKELEEQEIYGGVLTTCTGRGEHFFKVADFDAGSIQERLGPFGMAGVFCNGEFGPVGSINFIHGYTAALGVFVKKR